MSDLKARQMTDSAQGGEGTNSLHNKSWDAMLTDEFDSGQSQEPAKEGSTEGTK